MESDLTEAMRAAVDSVEQDRPARASRVDGATTPDVEVLDQWDLPPIRSGRYQAADLTDLLRTQVDHGRTLATAWVVVREVLVLVGMFWAAAILLAFADGQGLVTLGDSTGSLVASTFVATLALRATFLLAAVVGDHLHIGHAGR